MNAETYSLVLLGRVIGKDRAVAHLLAREFGRDDAWGLQVVGASPIVVVEGLSLDQAQAIHNAMAEVEAAGSRFELQQSVEEGTAKISWPAAPRIRGRLVAEFGGPAAAQQAAPAIIGGRSVATLLVPCPYTGQKLKVTIAIQVSKATEGGTAIHASATVAAAPSAPTAMVPLPQAAPPRPPSRGNQIPHAQPAQTPSSARAPIPVPTQIPVPRATPAPPQQQTAAPIIGLESLEELTPMEQFPPPEPGKPIPRSPVRGNPIGRSPGGGVPLPDVPVLHNSGSQIPRPPQQLPEVGQAVPVPQVSAPMDLEVFEQKVSSSGIFKAPQFAEEEESAAQDNGADNGVLCSVFMGKSGSPKVHQLVAELQGISVPEAARVCQKAIVAVAKDISEADAHEIKSRFSSINVTVRITKRK